MGCIQGHIVWQRANTHEFGKSKMNSMIFNGSLGPTSFPGMVTRNEFRNCSNSPQKFFHYILLTSVQTFNSQEEIKISHSFVVTNEYLDMLH